MTQRNRLLQEFLDSLQESFAASRCESDVAAAVAAVFAALARPAPAGSTTPGRLPVCQYLPTALSIGRSFPQLARLSSTFAALEPSLTWAVRSSGGSSASANWPDGHANATIVGPHDSIEQRDDLAIGASLLAPLVRYPDHRHPPEEVYLLLTPGRFRHGDSDWLEPGPGGTLHNERNILHAMASDDIPLLAFWCLLLK